MMHKRFLRTLCLALLLLLCLPMVACDMEIGGLVGELLADRAPQDEIPEPPEAWENDIMIEDIMPEIGTAIDTTWTEDFTGDIGYIGIETPFIDPAPDTTDPPIYDAVTIEPTTEAPTTEPAPPELVNVIAARSWDSLYTVNVNGDKTRSVFVDGYEYLSWTNHPIVVTELFDCALNVWGWVAFYSETEGTVGYSIDGGKTVFNEDFTYTAEQGVLDHVRNNIPGGQSACRMQFDIPITDLSAGDHTACLVARDPDGNEEILAEFIIQNNLPFVDRGEKNSFYYIWSFDTLMLDGQLYFGEDGMAEQKLKESGNRIVISTKDQYGILTCRGWSSFAQTADSFGYYLIGDSDEIIYGDFLMDRPDLEMAGILNGAGFAINIPVSDLAPGIYRVGMIERLSDGTVVRLYEFTLEMQ